MKAVVVQFPGSNGDRDAFHALRNVLGVPTEYVFHKAQALPSGSDLVVLPGGFSYGDYLRSGALARYSPVMAAVKAHAERGGLVLGICNGFQILTEAGMLPGALTYNFHQRFECRKVYVRVDADGPFTLELRGLVLELPVAHGAGRYWAPAQTLALIEREQRCAFRYVPKDTGNPNGSLADLAGLYGGPRRNVLGLMPHPERACEKVLGSEDGRAIFHAALRSVLARN